MNRNHSTEEQAAHNDRLAALLSVAPGLGQLYKGHYFAGCGFGILGTVVAVWMVTILSLAYAFGALVEARGFQVNWVAMLLNPVTICAGLLPLLLLWMAAATDAYGETDLRQHSTKPVSRYFEHQFRPGRAVVPDMGTPARVPARSSRHHSRIYLHR